MLSTHPARGPSPTRPAGRLTALALLPLAATALLGACASEPEVAYVPTYCYRTLADIDCHLEPDRTREARLVGVQLAKVGDPALAAYWVERHRLAREEGEARVEATDREIEMWRGTPVPEKGCTSLPCRVAGTVTETALGLIPVSPILAAF